MKIYKNILWCMASMALLASCTEEDYKLYDTTQKDSVFFEYRNSSDDLVDSMEYTFNYDIATVHTVEVPITLMGVPKDYDREVNVVPIADESDMVEGVNYTVTNNIIPANAVGGTVYINLIRDLDPDILETAKSVKFTITESDDLRPVGENSFKVIYSDIRPEVRPGWWLTYATIPTYSFEAAQLFFDYFHRYAPEANANTYDEMVRAYGMYFEKAPSIRGPFTNYENFLRQYVCLPLYLDHPELNWNPEYLPVW